MPTKSLPTNRRLAMLAVLMAGLLAGAPAAQAKGVNPLKDRGIVLGALLKSGVFHRDRQLVHLSHVCNLQISGRLFPVVDVMELVRGATTPRGVNRIIILTDKLVPVQTIDYTTQRPLFCQKQRLFVFGDLMIGNVLPEGNVLSFSDNGRVVDVQRVDANELPIPATGRGRPILQ